MTDKINIQLKPHSLERPNRIILIVIGLATTAFAIYQSVQAFSGINIAFGIMGMSLFFQGLDLIHGPNKLFLIINDSEIAFNFGSFTRPTTILIDEIDEVRYNHRRLQFDFMLSNGDHKKLYLRMIPYKRRDAVFNAINLISEEKKK